MKRAPFLTAAVAVSGFAIVAGPVTAQACQYCRMALQDPEAARMAAAIHGGDFPLDAAISQFQSAPVSADLKIAPAAASVATSASALTVPGLAGADSVPAPVIHRPVLAPPPTAGHLPPPVATVVKPSAKAAPVADDGRVNTAVIHWTDACLLGLVAAGGIFCWRTRRNQTPADR